MVLCIAAGYRDSSKLAQQLRDKMNQHAFTTARRSLLAWGWRNILQPNSKVEARREGMRNVKQDGIEKCLVGHTNISIATRGHVRR